MTDSDNLIGLIVGGVTRHVLTGVAGSLVAMGWITGDDQQKFITMGVGIAIGAAGLAWSWWNKVGHAKLADELNKLKP